MSHEIRQQDGDPPNPSSQQLKSPTGTPAEGVTVDDTRAERDKEPGGREAAQAKDAKRK